MRLEVDADPGAVRPKPMHGQRRLLEVRLGQRLAFLLRLVAGESAQKLGAILRLSR